MKKDSKKFDKCGMTYDGNEKIFHVFGPDFSTICKYFVNYVSKDNKNEIIKCEIILNKSNTPVVTFYQSITNSGNSKKDSKARILQAEKDYVCIQLNEPITLTFELNTANFKDDSKSMKNLISCLRKLDFDESLISDATLMDQKKLKKGITITK